MKFGHLSLLMATSALTLVVTPANAQEAAPTATLSDSSDIVVTARKRDETLIAVPVVISAVTAEALEKRAITNLDGVARVVPQLMIGAQGGSVQGGNVSIRGISGPDTNPFGDQAVSFNVDGVAISKASVRRMSDTDLSQIEVLKGPQALFYGKNSPAGIVSIRTADPTRRFEAKISSGYEFEAREWRTEGYVSAPVTETLGVRLSGYYSTQEGDLKEQTPSAFINANPNERNAESDDWAIRGTVKWEPTTSFDARLKLNYAETDNAGPQSRGQFVSCPTGVRQTGFVTGQCSVGGSNVNAGSGPVVGSIPATLNKFGNGDNFQNQSQFLGGLEMNFRPRDGITLTSVTGYYDVDLSQCQNYESDPLIILPSCNTLTNSEFSQELRASTDFDSRLNFTAGAYYADTTAKTGSLTYLFGNGFDLFPADALFPGSPALGGLNTPIRINQYLFNQDGSAWSIFGQARWNITPQLELDMGARYSHEEKTLTSVKSTGGFLTATPFLDAASLLTLGVKDVSYNDVSPEVTLSYRPSNDLTLFASYKEGFLSGGFNSSSSSLFNGIDLSYKPQYIDGFEAGVKANLFDDALFVTAAAYSYEISDLQVVSFTNATSTIRNAGSVKIDGVEAEFNYKTPVSGLSLHGAASYNKGKYEKFSNAPCYNGQTIALGCNGTFDPTTGAFQTQNLDGTELIRAPEVNASLGFDFETPIMNSFVLGLNGDVSYSDGYLTDPSSAPQSRQPDYTMFDASIRLSDKSDTWGLALIGRNLTDEYVFLASPNVPFTGSGQGTSVGALGDRFAVVGRGREIMLKASYKFGR